MTRILAVDPGGTSGWASSTLENPIADLRYGQHPPHELAHLMRAFTLRHGIWGSIDEEHVLIMERFTITVATGRKTQQTDALELIGVGKYLAAWNGVEFALQAPADAKKFATDAQLRRWGCWVPVQDHARDAVRHLLLACAKRGVFLIE